MKEAEAKVNKISGRRCSEVYEEKIKIYGTIIAKNG